MLLAETTSPIFTCHHGIIQDQLNLSSICCVDHSQAQVSIEAL